MHRASVPRLGEFTKIPHKMWQAVKRHRCQIEGCHAVYGTLKQYEWSAKQLILVKQAIHHLLPRRWLNERGIYEHHLKGLLSICGYCHGRAKVAEDRLFVADLMGFMEGMHSIGFPTRKIAAFAVSVGLKEFQRWLI
jgi:hypothetical protein